MSDRGVKDTATGEVVDVERARETGPKTCTTCGNPIDEYEWFPIRGREDEDGAFRIYSFCSEECVDSWEESGGG